MVVSSLFSFEVLQAPKRALKKTRNTKKYQEIPLGLICLPCFIGSNLREAFQGGKKELV
ncbi:hypothetical protein LEP1GSC202_0539 [Leptospira yanagawae serovar Saopaulo str. Sao Paulo = ATCC 700523]|uniref:Uncharacterized protein n=1 Tax=Leptospira yanagawae serovar Saopaulo str. Sao Paulo = ATCC 700523 TaxID=1249483 RepID=A0A5E8HIC8_9LEPT|nr:hypothetical protein LEP1GSC202_0539 [Leptospira yanagawae serovar Saopaulo str. Sao Paulo = ATCC 700523]